MATRNQGAVRTQQFLDDHPELTAKRLAEKCGMLPAQLCHLLKGRRIPTLSQARALNRRARVPLGSWLESA